MVGVARFDQRLALVGATFALLVGVLLFARLGHYALWDDEALVALSGEGVMRTGDTSIAIGHNIVAYRDGLLVRDMHDRSTPPLSAYLAAASMSIFGVNATAARLPFALFGLGAVILAAMWMRRQKAAPLTQFIAAILLLGNVSFFLYFRQCRYYAPTAFFSMAVVFAYLSWRGERRLLVGMALLSVALFAANYMAYVALYACILFDYLVWRRHERALSGADWLALALPQLIGCGLIAAIWNPLRTGFGGYLALNTFGDRISLFLWNWRDMIGCEFFVGPLVAVAVVVALANGQRMLLRALFALAVYVAAITLLSPQIVANGGVADVRYLMSVIPLGIAIETMTIVALCGKRPRVALVVAAVASGTNVLQAGPLLPAGFRSTVADYVAELADPPGDPYTPTARWINENVRDGESVWVEPYYMAYPLMFHAPGAIYAWQLSQRSQPQFSHLPPVNFRLRVPPDYIVAFGPFASKEVGEALATLQQPGLRYERAATIDFYWHDMHRPELFLRTFRPMTGYDAGTEAIYILKKVSDPPPGQAPHVRRESRDS